MNGGPERPKGNNIEHLNNARPKPEAVVPSAVEETAKQVRLDVLKSLFATEGARILFPSLTAEVIDAVNQAAYDATEENPFTTDFNVVKNESLGKSKEELAASILAVADLKTKISSEDAYRILADVDVVLDRIADWKK